MVCKENLRDELLRNQIEDAFGIRDHIDERIVQLNSKQMNLLLAGRGFESISTASH